MLLNAVRMHAHGEGPDSLVYEDVAEPTPQPGEVLLKVKACALNHLDLWVRRGIPAYQPPLPHILGSDIAGEVAAVGQGVVTWNTGEHVVAYPAVACGECRFCLRGRENLCRKLQIVGAHIPGGYAEYVCLPASSLFPLPKALTFEEAAAVPLVFCTAWHMLITRAKVQPAETVLVLAAGGGVGTAAVQIAKLSGARVLACSGSDDKLKRLTELGADEAINHTRKDIAEEARRLTDGRGVDVVVEQVGADTWSASLEALARGGRLVTCGATTGSEASFDIRALFSREWEFIGSMLGTRAELQQVLQLVEQERVSPVVGEVFPLEKAAAAHTALEDRRVFGKAVLQIEAET